MKTGKHLDAQGQPIGGPNGGFHYRYWYEANGHRQDTKRWVLYLKTSVNKLDSGERDYAVEECVIATSNSRQPLVSRWNNELAHMVNQWFSYVLRDNDTEEEWELHTGEWETYED